MNKSDIPLMAAQLNAVAEVLGKPAVSVKAMEVWFDVLREFPAESVMDVLNGWAKFNGRFPTPAQVWERVNEKQIEGRERKAAFERSQNVRGMAMEPSTEEAKIFIARIREILSQKKKPFREHFREMAADPKASFMQVAFAKEALKNLGDGVPVSDPEADHYPLAPASFREPGQDDEERIAA